MTIQKTVILTSALGFGLMTALAQPFYLQLDGGVSFQGETDHTYVAA